MVPTFTFLVDCIPKANGEEQDTCKEQVEKLPLGLRSEYILFVSNFYVMMSHCFIVIRGRFSVLILLLLPYYFCSVLTYLAIFQRSSTLTCDACDHIRPLPIVMTWKMCPSLMFFKASDL